MNLTIFDGIIEGKVNKLKLLKRMGYSRAGFSQEMPVSEQSQAGVKAMVTQFADFLPTPQASQKRGRCAGRRHPPLNPN